MMNPVPSMAQVFSLLIQEEKQREFKPAGRMPMESTSLNASVLNNKCKCPQQQSSRRKKFLDKLSNNNYAGSTYTSGGVRSGGNNYYHGSNSNKRAIVSDFCKKTGYTRDKCYKLHGYPQNNNLTFRQNGSNSGQNYTQGNQSIRGKKVVANVHNGVLDVMTPHGEEQSVGSGFNNANITKEQYGKMMDLLQHFQNENMGEDSNASSVSAGSMNFAGPFSEEASSAW